MVVVSITLLYVESETEAADRPHFLPKAPCPPKSDGTGSYEVVSSQQLCHGEEGWIGGNWSLVR